MNLLETYKNINCKSDKEHIHKYISRFYNDKFFKYKNKNISLLEIGIQYGHSLKLWESYFNFESTIIGIDNRSYFTHTYGLNVQTIIMDAYSLSTIEYFKRNNLFFDIIIDDGPHTLETQIFFLSNYPQMLKSNNSIIILEDVYSDTFNILKHQYPDYTILDYRNDTNNIDQNSVIFYKENTN